MEITDLNIDSKVGDQVYGRESPYNYSGRVSKVTDKSDCIEFECEFTIDGEQAFRTTKIKKVA